MKKELGISFIELIVTLSILSILGSIAVPSMSYLVEKSASTKVTHTTRSLLATAREFSIDLKYRVKICGINELDQCQKKNFKQIAIFIDHDKNNQIDNDDDLLLVKKLKFNGQTRFSASLGKSYIEFKQNGFAAQAGSFIYCKPKYLHFASRVTTNMAGRSYIAKDMNGDGYVETASRNPIDCT